MGAKVRGEHAKAFRQPILGELAEAAAVTGYAVQANDRRGARLAPLVNVELQSSDWSSAAGGS
jgi:hypothetical protein